MTAQETCPYGLACRFLGSHKDGVEGGDLSAHRRSSEVNGLTKDVQKLFWKNKMKFPKADAKLKALGLEGNAKSKIKILEAKGDDQVVSNRCRVTDGNGCSGLPADIGEEGGLDETCPYNEPRPSKKPRSVIEEEICSGKVDDGGASAAEEVVEQTSTAPEPEATVGNLPFRRVCKVLGDEMTCGEMAICINLLQGQASEWALLRRRSSKDLFGVQLCGSYPDTVAHTVDLIDQEYQPWVFTEIKEQRHWDISSGERLNI